MFLKRIGSQGKSVLWKDVQEIIQSLLYVRKDTCLLCEEPQKGDPPFCPICKQNYFHPESERCHQCGKIIPKEFIRCTDCEEGRGPKGLEKVVAWGHYSGAWREFIQGVKFKAQPYRLKEIGRPLADWAVKQLPPPDFLVPVPMHPARLAERGFNQAAGIASLLHWELGIPLIEALERVHFTVPQVGLKRNERLHNLKGAFQIACDDKIKVIRGTRIWLVDDVTTTGATLEACAEELKRNGVMEVYGLTLAAGINKELKRV
jgi:competence protein ComFC